MYGAMVTGNAHRRPINMDQKWAPPGAAEEQFRDLVGRDVESFLLRYQQRNGARPGFLPQPSQDAIVQRGEQVSKVYRRHEDISRVDARPRLGFFGLVQEAHYIDGQRHVVRPRRGPVQPAADQIICYELEFCTVSAPRLSNHAKTGPLELLDHAVLLDGSLEVRGYEKSKNSGQVQGVVRLYLITQRLGVQSLEGWKLVDGDWEVDLAGLVCVDVC